MSTPADELTADALVLDQNETPEIIRALLAIRQQELARATENRHELKTLMDTHNIPVPADPNRLQSLTLDRLSLTEAGQRTVEQSISRYLPQTFLPPPRQTISPLSISPPFRHALGLIGHAVSFYEKPDGSTIPTTTQVVNTQQVIQESDIAAPAATLAPAATTPSLSLRARK